MGQALIRDVKQTTGYSYLAHRQKSFAKGTLEQNRRNTSGEFEDLRLMQQRLIDSGTFWIGRSSNLVTLRSVHGILA